MTDDVARIAERGRQRRAQQLAADQAAALAPMTAERRMGTQLQPGHRVIDTVTGQEGEVVGGTRKTLIVQTA